MTATTMATVTTARASAAPGSLVLTALPLAAPTTVPDRDTVPLRVVNVSLASRGLIAVSWIA